MAISLAACSSGSDVSNRGIPARSAAEGKAASRPTSSDASGWTPEEKAIIDRWYRLNGQCRGESGDNPTTMEACDQREIATARLEAADICYGRKGEFGYQMVMHRCADQ